MTIKAIKERYKGAYDNEKTMFTTFDYKDGNGKVVIVVTRNAYWRTVRQVVRVKDGKELLETGRCRHCDNLDDAVDVAGEMIR